MKKSLLKLTGIALLSLLSSNLLAQENPEIIRDRQEAITLRNNFITVNKTFAEEGGTLSLETIQNLLAQMEANKSTEVIYRFGRTTNDNSGKNIIMFFNNNYTVDQLNGINKFKSVNLCPNNCNSEVDSYLK